MGAQNSLKDQRGNERISANIEARFVYGNMLYSGVITSISEDGMHIRTGICPLHESRIIILFDAGNKMFQIGARVVRAVKKDGYCDGMGIEIIDPSGDYLELINSKKVAMFCN